MGYCPFSSSGCDTARLYRDTAGHRRAPGHDTTWPACRGAQQRSRDTVQPTTTQSAARATWVCIATRFLCHDGGVVCARDTAQRHGPATRRPTHDTAQCALRHGAVCVAWPWVCAQCTRPNFDTVHCLGSMFGSLFMDTVHGVFKKKRKKRVLKNKIFVCV